MGKAMVGGLTLFIIIFGFLAISFDTVQPHHKGVKIKLSEVVGTMDAGIAFTGPFTSVYEYDLQVRQMEIDLNGENFAPAKDKQKIFVNLAINYRLKDDASVVMELKKRYGEDEVLEQKLKLRAIITDGVKQAIVQYTADEIQEDKQAVKNLAVQKIKENFPNEYFEIEMIVIENIYFTPAYQNAIENAKIAEKEAVAEEKKVAIKQAQAEQKIKETWGKTESRKLEIDADAYQLTEIAKAEAEALRLKSNELTDLMVANNWIDAWQAGGAQVPMYMTDGTNNQFLMSLPTME